ncbi:MAG TPA: hypothetical protein VEB21_02695, partial [Terriglobales bacterium]|nr:hypothetical protein [Terriglobales bacterium]
ESGESVVIERRGIRFKLAPDKARRPAPRRSLIAEVDPVVLGGDWSWKWGASRLTFVARKRRP